MYNAIALQQIHTLNIYNVKCQAQLHTLATYNVKHSHCFVIIAHME